MPPREGRTRRLRLRGQDWCRRHSGGYGDQRPARGGHRGGAGSGGGASPGRRRSARDDAVAGPGVVLNSAFGAVMPGRLLVNWGPCPQSVLPSPSRQDWCRAPARRGGMPTSAIPCAPPPADHEGPDAPEDRPAAATERPANTGESIPPWGVRLSVDPRSFGGNILHFLRKQPPSRREWAPAGEALRSPRQLLVRGPPTVSLRCSRASAIRRLDTAYGKALVLPHGYTPGTFPDGRPLPAKHT